MNLYLITPKEETNHGGWDTYDSAVVAAESAEAACQIHPSEGERLIKHTRAETWRSDYSSWVDSPSLVDAMLIGTAAPGITEEEVILASFNAG